MKLLVHKTTRILHDASNLGAWRDLPDFLEIVDVPGDAETFVWPNGFPSRCMLDNQNMIIANPAWQPSPPTALARALDALLAVPNPIIPQIVAVLRVWRQTAL